MGRLYGLIPAAGKGTRAYPYTSRTPKGMLRINGVPNIERNIAVLRDDLGISDICIVTGYHGDVIREYFGDGNAFGVSIRYVHNEHIDRGLAWTILLARQHIDDYFCSLLSDECYVGSNHRELLFHPFRDALATCGVYNVRDREIIKANYSVEERNGRVTRLVEKPKAPPNNRLGSGTFVFSPRIFDLLEGAFAESGGGAVDLVSFRGSLVEAGEDVRSFTLTGRYTNINTRDSYQLAKYYVRDSIMDDAFKHLLIYSEGDEPDIAFTVREYLAEPSLDRVSVIVPRENSVAEEVAATGAGVITCPPEVTLYGEKILYGLDHAEGDLLILTEADYSFHVRDISKLLGYIREADMVIGTRTTRQLIEQGSNMRGIVRLSHIILAKTMEVLWWGFESRFTDVGCTFRAVWRSAFETIRPRVSSRGPAFSAEMMIELIYARERVIEIPVSYYARSFSMFRKYQNFRTFLSMLRVIIGKRFGRRRPGRDFAPPP
jgi:dTDP-glucose pyrophosphorylase